MTAVGSWFSLPPEAEADRPPEARGLARDGVRLLASTPKAAGHHRFAELPDLLAPGDLLVVNTSATLAAALAARTADGGTRTVHVARVGGHPDDRRSHDWVVEVRAADGGGPDPGARAGDVLRLAGGGVLILRTADPEPVRLVSRLWRAQVDGVADAGEHLRRHGRPVRYSYLHADYPLEQYQTVWATVPGSTEMPSAGRPFSEHLVTSLVARGVTVAPLVLHCGLSSSEGHEPPQPEWWTVPEDTARLVTSARAAGRRVVAVGTTVVRALESAAEPSGVVRPGQGWTDLVLGPSRPARVVDGLVSGLHTPEASHLDLLTAVVGDRQVRQAYDAVLAAGGYLWHEFGDSMLLLRW